MNTRLAGKTGLLHAPIAVLALLTLAAPRPAAAADRPFILQLTVDGQTYVRSYSKTSDLLDLLKAGGINRIAPNYRNNSAISATLNLRGVPATVERRPGSTALRLVVPDAKVDRSFDGGTDDASRQLLRDFTKGTEAGMATGAPAGPGTGSAPTANADLREIVRSIVANSTADPVAGNPASLLSQSVAADFAAGTQPAGDIGDMGPREAGWHFSLGTATLRQEARQFDTEAYSLPLGVSYTFGEDGLEVFFNAPLAMTETSGAHSYMGSAGLGLRVPVIRAEALRWSLSPAIRYGAAGSTEIGAVGSVLGFSATSDLRVALPHGLVLGIGNGIGHYQTRPIKVGEYELKYDFDNTYLRNGISIFAPVGEIQGRAVTLGVSVTDTRLYGQSLAVDNWQEYGISATIGRSAPVRLSATFLDGARGYRGFQVGLSTAF
jgi:hypothetical protein